MAFQFRLKTLLEYRQHLLKNGQVSLANAQLRYHTLHTKREQLQEQIAHQETTWREQQIQGIPVAEHLLCLGYLQALEQKLHIVEQRLAEALQEVDAAREALIKRETEVQMLESLKVRAQEEYRYQELKQEQKRLDATAIFADYQKRDKVSYE